MSEDKHNYTHLTLTRSIPLILSSGAVFVFDTQVALASPYGSCSYGDAQYSMCATSTSSTGSEASNATGIDTITNTVHTYSLPIAITIVVIIGAIGVAIHNRKKKTNRNMRVF